ncbi:hypothetical protein ACFL4W_03895 [Planctomycetota bacterium]
MTLTIRSLADNTHFPDLKKPAMIPEIINNEFAKNFGPPDSAQASPLTDRFPGRWGAQIVYPLAWMYTHEAEGNDWYQHPVMLEMHQTVTAEIFRFLKEEGDYHSQYRRVGYPLAHSVRLLRDHVDPELFQSWKDDLTHIMREGFVPMLRECERLTILSSANVGYGTNHLAIELSGVVAYVNVFRDDPDWPDMEPGGRALEQFVREYVQRFMAYMDEGGYWAECDGPAQAYNTLTANSLLRAVLDLDEAETYRSHFEKAAHYHTYHLLPNLRTTGIMDGRNRQGYISTRISFCGFIPEGRRMLREIRRANLELSREEKPQFSGEALNEMLTDVKARSCFPEAAEKLIWEEESYTDTTRDDFAVIKRGPWIAGLSNFEFRPRPEGHWNLDYQNLLSLYHQQCGIILSGNNSKNDPELSTFNKQFTTFDGYPIDPPMWKYIPGKGRIEIREKGAAVRRDYRGFEGTLEFEVLSPDEGLLIIKVDTRVNEYPVTCALQPALQYKAHFEDGNGKEYEITEEALHLTGKDLGGSIKFGPEEKPDISTDKPGKAATVSIPDEAELIWPFKPWDPYNLKTDRHSHPGGWTLLLNIPIGPEGQEIGITIQ